MARSDWKLWMFIGLGVVGGCVALIELVLLYLTSGCGHDARHMQMRVLSQTIELYAAEHDGYPASIIELVEAKLITPRKLIDPYGNTIVYLPSDPAPACGAAQNFDLCSPGADHLFGTEDDYCASDAWRDPPAY